MIACREIDAKRDMLKPKICVIGFTSGNGPQARKMSRQLLLEIGKMGAICYNCES